MINIMLSDRRFSIDKRNLKSLAETVMDNESAKNKNVNIVFCTDKLIMDLNSRYLQNSRTTDVLAFELEETDDSDLLGEVYINLQQAERQARENKINYLTQSPRVHRVILFSSFYFFFCVPRVSSKAGVSKMLSDTRVIR